jgi:hypothetical protein
MSNDHDLSPAEILAQIKRRYPAVAKIISRMEKLNRAANTQLWIALLYRPDLRPGILPVPENVFRSLCDLAGKTQTNQNDKWKELVDWLATMVEKQEAALTERAKCSKLKKEKTRKLHKEIDELILQGFSTENNAIAIYNHIRDHRPELLKIKSSKRFTDPKNVWKKYQASKRKWE